MANDPVVAVWCSVVPRAANPPAGAVRVAAELLEHAPNPPTTFTVTDGGTVPLRVPLPL
jgi:hypothetical protein